LLLQQTGDKAVRDLVVALTEWEVALPGGETASHTDVMAICRNDAGVCVIGVEAKVGEDFGPLLGEKRATASSGQNQRLDYLHELLDVPGSKMASGTSCCTERPRP